MTTKPRRPVKYTPEVGTRLCHRLAKGEILRTICEAPGMPSRTTVLRWITENSEFRTQYNIARDYLTDALSERAIHASETATDKNANARRLYVDTIKWYVAKVSPRKFGDKVDIHVSGTVSVGDAIEMGRQRVARLRDVGNVVDLRPVLSLPAPSEEPLES